MEEKEGLKVMGRDVSKIPCFRSTFLFSMPAGIGAALLHFMFTSKVQKSGHIGMATFIVSTLGYWSHCRYNYSVQKFKLGQLPKHLMTKEFQDERRND